MPFVALFDNCYGDVVQDLTGIAVVNSLMGLLQPFVDRVVAEVHTDGLALYAAQPGEMITDVPDEAAPRRADGGYERIGPLALHLTSVLEEQDTAAMTMTQFGRTFGAEGATRFESVVRNAADFEDWRPHIPAGARLLPRTANAALFPALPREPVEIEMIHGTGRSEQRCCG